MLIAIGAVVNILMLIGAANSKTFWGFWFCYCFGIGINTGLAYLVPIHHCWLWFPKHPGLASGIVLAGYGFGGMIFNSMTTPLINPDNLSFDDECYPGANYGCYPQSVNDNFKKMWYTLISIFIVFIIIGVAFIWQGPIAAEFETEVQQDG